MLVVCHAHQPRGGSYGIGTDTNPRTPVTVFLGQHRGGHKGSSGMPRRKGVVVGLNTAVILAKGGFWPKSRRTWASRQAAYVSVRLFVRFPYFCGATDAALQAAVNQRVEGTDRFSALNRPPCGP